MTYRRTKPKRINEYMFLQMIGLTEPTSGKALVEGLDICNQMNEIYTSMGVCPQHEYVSNIKTLLILIKLAIEL